MKESVAADSGKANGMGELKKRVVGAGRQPYRYRPAPTYRAINV
ncbi:MAG: hypothetical protein OXN17_13365 [Candidatus Poribacteria bacterium]|nr:hypothetical protein [Candidatus Poribacteria bacterium]MDE0502480.1 hypothetical protein [Candidatus Poribacteria bacterium]